MLPEKDERIAKVIELSKEALDAFCDDIGTMFEVDMTCQEQEVLVTDLQSIQKHFNRLTAVHTITSEGALEGNFQLIFDQGGLFTLAGVIVMLPAKRILDEVEFGTLEQAQNMGDVVGEVGNLLVGTWDRTFREGLENHRHFRKASTFMGDPWSDPSKIEGLADSEKFHFILCEIAIESYPCFQCAVLLPLETKAAAEDAATAADPGLPAAKAQATGPNVNGGTILEQAEAQGTLVAETLSDDAEETATLQDRDETAPVEEAASEPEPAFAVEEDLEETAQEAEDLEVAVEDTEQAATSESEPTFTVEEDLEETAQEAEAPDAATDKAEEEAPADDVAVAGVEAADALDVDVETEANTVSAGPARPEATQSVEAGDEPVQTAAPEIISVSSPGPGEAGKHEGLGTLMSLTAHELMSSLVVWVSPEDSVNEALAAMQQHDVGYVMVGEKGILQGLVSKSNVLGALSPYLRPVFAKWRRPADDATMDIKVQWIMSRPVRTVCPEAPLCVVVDQMRQFGGRCLPVAAAGGCVQGLITVFDILRVLTPDLDASLAGHTPQAPCLMV